MHLLVALEVAGIVQAKKQGPLIRSRLDLSTVKPREQFEFYQEEVSRRYAGIDCTLTAEREDYPVHMDMIHLGSSACTLILTPSSIFQRSKQHIQKDDQDGLIMSLSVSGQYDLEYGDQRRCSTPGKVLFLDTSNPVQLDTSGPDGMYQGLSVHLRRDLFTDSDALNALFCERRFEHHRYAGMLQSSLSELAASMKRINDHHTAFLLQLCENLAFLIAHDKTADVFHEGSEEASVLIKAQILSDIENPDLSLQWVSNKLGVSDDYVQRVMKYVGMRFAEFVHEKRILLAINKICDKKYSRTSIEDIAFSCGFDELDSFYRSLSVTFRGTGEDFNSYIRDTIMRARWKH